ncbi:phage tail protein [Dyella marensis]|uniref:Phage tail tube protein, TTP n=1 Tax=Dyella marensis TaxID=500610 RepID=A0A1I1ZXQ0_9GAMM|nr:MULTISPECIES: phage tail protein [Dyella]SFE36462.1 Phage tail tube protein, TTP [Dyella marensis]
MSSIFPNGTRYSVSKTLAAAVAISAISNANPAVASAATPPADGSIVILTSGWGDLQPVARTKGGTANNFQLERVDTTDTVDFPAGQGAGSFALVSDWFEIDQVRNSAITGGEQQFFTYQYVNDRKSLQKQKPTFKTPVVITLTLDYDPDKPWYDGLIAADELKDPIVLRAILPNGQEMYYYAYPSFNPEPIGPANENQTNTATFSLLVPSIRYPKVA